MSDSIPAVAYWRMSSDPQEGSIPQQQGAMRPKAKLAGLEILREFQDEGISGGKMAKRDAFHEMLAYCQEQRRQGKPVEAIICWDTKRFSRASSIETNHYLWEFMQAGVYRMFTHSDGWIDFRREEHRVLFNLRQDISNNRDLRDRSRDVSRGKLATFQGGYWNGGVSPYGFDRLVIDQHGNPVERVRRGEKLGMLCKEWKVRLVPTEDAEVLEVLRWLFDRYARTETSVHALCRELNEKGIPGPGSGTKNYGDRTGWKVGSLLRILTNPHYVGDLRYGYESRGQYHRIIGSEIREADAGRGTEYHEGAPVNANTHDGIIDRQTWELVQAKLKNRRGWGTKPRAVGFLLPGDLVRCGHCGAKMYGMSAKSGGKRTRSYRYYACSGNQNKPGTCRYLRIREDRLLPLLVRKIQTWYLAPERLEKLRQRLREKLLVRHEGEPRRAERLKARIADLDRDIRQGARNLVRATDNLDLIQEEINALRAQRDKLARDLEAAEAAQGVPAEEIAGKIDAALARLRDLGRQLDLADPQRFREVVRQLVSRIDLYFEDERKTPGMQRSPYPFAKGVIKLRPQLEVSRSAGSVPDVLTTGSTASEAAGALRDAGAGCIVVAVLARSGSH
jgi:DNA invertase Pin-like site-specific DNA recombinase